MRVYFRAEAAADVDSGLHAPVSRAADGPPSVGEPELRECCATRPKMENKL